MVNSKTLESYKKAGVDYMQNGYDEHLRLEREKTSSDKNKKRYINKMVRVMTQDGEEFITYEQQITALSNYTRNKVTWHENKNETSIHFEPEVEFSYTYDAENEQQLKQIKQVASVRTVYDIPFTKEEAEKLLPFTNLRTEFLVEQEGGRKRAAPSYNAWLEWDFDELLKGHHDEGYPYNDYYYDRDRDEEQQQEQNEEQQQLERLQKLQQRQAVQLQQQQLQEQKRQQQKEQQQKQKESQQPEERDRVFKTPDSSSTSS